MENRSQARFWTFIAMVVLMILAGFVVANAQDTTKDCRNKVSITFEIKRDTINCPCDSIIL